jgi:hypothetical protein
MDQINKNISVSNTKDTAFGEHEQVKQSIADKVSENAFKDKSFFVEYRPVFLCMLVYRFGGSVFSLMTVFIAINYIIGGVFNYVAALFCAAILAISLEGCKGFLGSIAWKHQLKYTKGATKAIKAAWFVFCLVSIFASLYGTYRLPEMQPFEHDIKEVVPYINPLDSLNSALARAEINKLSTQIEDLQTEIKNTSSNSTKRGLNTSMRLLIQSKSEFQKSINSFNSSNKIFNDSLKQDFNTAVFESTKKHKDNLYKTQTDLVFLALLIEGFLFLANGFIYYYYYRNEVDKAANGLRKGNEENGNQYGKNDLKTVYVKSNNNALIEPKTVDVELLETAANETESPPTENVKERKKIGFGNGETVVNVTAKTPIVDQLTGIICACDTCNNSFNRKSTNKKYCSSKCKMKQYNLRKQRNS